MNVRETSTGTASRQAANLWLVTTPKGTKSWRFRCRVRGRLESVTLGRMPGMDAKEARDEARRLRTMADRGRSPREDYRRRRFGDGDGNPTVRDFGGRWLEEVVEKVRKDPKPVRRLLDREVYPWIGTMRVGHVRPEDLRRIVFRKRDAGRPESAAAIRHALKRIFDYAMACGIAEKNPMLATPLKFVAKHRSRRRVLTKDELRIFRDKVRAPELGPGGAALELLLLTLSRKSELLQARKAHVDLEAGIWEIPAELSKTGVPHIVYLSGRARALMARLIAIAPKSEMILPARNAVGQPLAASALNKLIRRTRWGFPAFTPHDLRRTGSTVLNEQGYNPDWIEKALNHGAKGVRGVYNRAEYAEQRRKMLEDWAEWIEKL